MEAGQGATKGPRCALVDQIQQGQGPRGSRSEGREARRSRYPDVRLQRGYEPVRGTGEARSHIGIDKAHGLGLGACPRQARRLRIRTWGASAANAHDGARLPDLISKGNTGSGVWADTAYRLKKNEAFLAGGMFTSHIHQRRKPRRPMSERIAKANTRRSKIRAQVEHVFAGQKHRMGLVVRTIGIARATIKIGMANLAYMEADLPDDVAAPRASASPPLARHRSPHERAEQRHRERGLAVARQIDHSLGDQRGADRPKGAGLPADVIGDRT